MALSIISEPVADFIAATYIKGYNIKFPRSAGYQQITGSDGTGLSDQAPADATFDTQHLVYNDPWVDGASQNAIGDNTTGPMPTLTLEPTLSYTYTTGYSTEHEQSKGVTVGVTQSFDYEFAGVGGGTTLSASGTFTWTDSTGTDNTTSVTSAVATLLEVPIGKKYEASLLFQQEQVSVPYSWSATMTGNIVYDFDQGATQPFSIGDTFWYAEGAARYGPLGPFSGVDWTDFLSDYANLIYNLNGTLTIQGASTYTIKTRDVTNANSQAVQAEYDPAVPIGVRRIMDDTGRTFRDTPFDDAVDGGAGNDRILFGSGEDVAHAGGGDDLIRAEGVGRSLLDGGAGDDTIRLTSTAQYGTVLGGDGDDRLHVDAPAAMLYGGAGDDRYFVKGDTAGGTVITDTAGRNRLRIETDDPIGFERLDDSDDLYILLGGGETYDRTRDVVWLDFFANGNNRVGDFRPVEIEALLAPPPPPTTNQFINAANWTYSRDESDLPADLLAFEVNGQHLTQEVTGSGFYGAAFLTPDDQLVIAFEGTHLSALDDDPVFVAAQLAADVQIYLGQVPQAYLDALAFTQTAIAAASARGIGRNDVYLTGHSLGAAEAQYVARELTLQGETYGGPGIPPEAGIPSVLTNYVEYGDPVGNYSADPNYLNGFLYSDDILRFGEPTYIGDPLARLGLETAGALFGPGTTPAENATGLAALAGLADEYHVLTTYAADLGVTLDDPGAYGGDGGDAAGLLAAAQALLAAGVAAEPAFA